MWEKQIDINAIDRLVDLAFTTPSLDGLLGLAPVKATRETVKRIYQAAI